MQQNLCIHLHEQNSYDSFVHPREGTKLWMGWSIAAQVSDRIKHAVVGPFARDAEDPAEANGWVY